ncbi:unnamed protein product [Prorocentrum cordatum]|uniref:G domain-containing protein n=1 Tax=Prorocentrum cordatum TaxID=2364126 RepID=A0ABN9VHS2_9DINO|nr:unnamed protein product [Polarella glacialis]
MRLSARTFLKKVARDWGVIKDFAGFHEMRRWSDVTTVLDYTGDRERWGDDLSEDTRIWETVQGAGRKLMVVLTKVDRCHADDLHRNVAEVTAALQHLDRELVWPFVHAVSADHDLGMRELRASLSIEAHVATEEESAGSAERPIRGLLRHRRRRPG